MKGNDTNQPSKLELMLLTEPPASRVDALTMDSTSHTEISTMANKNFVGEIFDDLGESIDLDQLVDLKRKDPQEFLSTVTDPIKELWGAAQSIEFHASMFVVRTLFILGMLLNDVREVLVTRSEFVLWIRANFAHKHLRIFQQARQLASMGKFALLYASLGKNRLLEFDRLRKLTKKSLEQILLAHPFQDTTADIDVELFKEHIDAIITYYRLIEGEIQFVSFEQAEVIASYLHSSISVSTVKGIKKWLDSVGNPEYCFEVLVFNHLAYPDPTESKTRMLEPTINKVLANVARLRQQIESLEGSSLEGISVDEETLREAHQAVVAISEKFRISLA